MPHKLSREKRSIIFISQGLDLQSAEWKDILSVCGQYYPSHSVKSLVFSIRVKYHKPFQQSAINAPHSFRFINGFPSKWRNLLRTSLELSGYVSKTFHIICSDIFQIMEVHVYLGTTELPLFRNLWSINLMKISILYHVECRFIRHHNVAIKPKMVCSSAPQVWKWNFNFLRSMMTWPLIYESKVVKTSFPTPHPIYLTVGINFMHWLLYLIEMG